jgi:hypothetical protein
MDGLTVYEGEPCQICGRRIWQVEVVHLKSGDNKPRPIHADCWWQGVPVKQWAHPEGTRD